MGMILKEQVAEIRVPELKLSRKKLTQLLEDNS